jgi:hypothetical protein
MLEPRWMIPRWNGSRWPAGTDPTAGDVQPAVRGHDMAGRHRRVGGGRHRY